MSQHPAEKWYTFEEGRCWAQEYDDLLMAELERITSSMIILDGRGVFEGVAQQIATRMASVYGSHVGELCVRRRLEYMRDRYETFVTFLSRPGVYFKYDDNKVVIDWPYFESFEQLNRDECEFEYEFRTTGFKYYTTCESVWLEKQAPKLSTLPSRGAPQLNEIERRRTPAHPRIWD